jgi:hypothetical protein
MKTAAKQFAREWEEAQLLQLARFTEHGFKFLKLFLNLFLYIAYSGLRWTALLIHVALLAPPNEPNVRDEQWIYRQIK